MSDVITLSLPSEFTQDEMEALLVELRENTSEAGARALRPRSVDPHTMIAIIEVVGGMITNASAAWTLIDKIRSSLRSRKVAGAHITLPNGTHLDIEKVDEADLRRLIGTASSEVQQT